MIRLPLTIAEFNAIALAMSARSSTISTTKVWRAGVSNALMTPWRTWSDRINGTVTVSVNTMAARANDCSIESTCV